MKFRYFGALVRLFRREFLRDPFLLEVKRWFRDDGDHTLRLNYPLNSSSVVWDLGGYHGDFAEEIFSRYKSTIFLFEPVPKFYSKCLARFEKNSKIQCLPFGLARDAGWFEISDDEDASSFVRDAGNHGSVRAEIKPVVEMFNELKIDYVDLLKINIEGGEFDVLPSLIESGLINRIRFLQIQFHNFIPDAINKRDLIREQLKRTHNETWNYPFVWESWERKSDQ